MFVCILCAGPKKNIFVKVRVDDFAASIPDGWQRCTGWSPSCPTEQQSAQQQFTLNQLRLDDVRVPTEFTTIWVYLHNSAHNNIDAVDEDFVSRFFAWAKWCKL